MAMEIVEDASVTLPLAGPDWNADMIVADGELAPRLASALTALAAALAA